MDQQHPTLAELVAQDSGTLLQQYGLSYAQVRALDAETNRREWASDARTWATAPRLARAQADAGAETWERVCEKLGFTPA